MKYLKYLIAFILIILVGSGYYYLYNKTLLKNITNSSFTNNNNLEFEKETKNTEDINNKKNDSTAIEITTNKTISNNSNINNNNSNITNENDNTSSSTKNITENNTYTNTSKLNKNTNPTASINITAETNDTSNTINNTNENNEDFNSIIVIEVDTNNYNNTLSNSNNITSTDNNRDNTLPNESNDNNNTNNTANNPTKENQVALEIDTTSTNVTANDKDGNTKEENQDMSEITNKYKKEEEIKIVDGIIKNSTGYSAVNNKKYLKEKASNKSKSITLLKAGEPFKILSTNIEEKWWKVEYNGKFGYVENAYCFINLPDFIPSITYEITNANQSIYKSSNYDLPNITREKLYNTGKIYNERLGKEEYIVPVAYNFAKKIYNAQQDALEEGYSLKIYDAYRPTSVAKALKNSLANLYKSNSTVKANINYSYSNGIRYTWGQNWFIAQKLSDHSLSSAIDVTLTKKGSTKDLQMPSNMHELSTKAIKYRYAVSSQTTVRNDLYALTMTKYAKKLDSIMLNNEMNNLASEWWHFQDKSSYTLLKKIEPSGIDITFDTIVSEKY